MSSSSLTPTEDLLVVKHSHGFQCSERLTKENTNEAQRELLDELPVTFSIVFPQWRGGKEERTFLFGCQRPSFGSLEENEENIKDFDASAVDPNFFDSGYTLAGSTGFCVWAGARFLLEALVVPPTSEYLAIESNKPSLSRLIHYRQQLSKKGLRVLELGAGVGLGIVLASAGAEVLLTDLPTLVRNAVEPNLYLNSQQGNDDPQGDGEEHRKPPNWLRDCEHVERIGEGWAAAAPLDWTKPVKEQLSSEQCRAINVIVASDCIFLEALLKPFLDTVQTLFEEGAPSLLISFQPRGERIMGSALFTTEQHLVNSVDARGWGIQIIGWKPLTRTDGTKEIVMIVEIEPEKTS